MQDNPVNVDEDLSKVTVLTWMPSQSIRHSGMSAGHSALRTYRGGPDGKGVYVSFWPGDNQWVRSCGEHNQKY